MLKQKLQQKLLQKLSPQQIQMIKLLEVPTLQIEQRIKKELEENPALEEGQEEDEEIENGETEEEQFEDNETRTRRNSPSTIISKKTKYLNTAFRQIITARRMKGKTKFLILPDLHFRNILNHSWD